MKLTIKLISVLYFVVAILGILGLAFTYGDTEFSNQFKGVSIYKIPLIIINSVLLIFASYKSFKLQGSSIVLYALSIALYFAIATYDQFIRYSFNLFDHIMIEFFYSLGIRILSVLLLLILLNKVSATETTGN